MGKVEALERIILTVVINIYQAKRNGENCVKLFKSEKISSDF